MSPRPLTDAELAEAVRLRAELGNTCAMARALGISENAGRNRLAHAAARGMMGTAPVLPGYAIKSVSSQLNGETGGLEREWVRQAKEPGDTFTPPPDHRIAGLSVLTDGSGREIQRWWKTKAETKFQDVVSAIQGAFETYRGRAQLSHPPQSTRDDMLSVYVLTDIHHGLMAWKPESGADYDISIGSKRLRSCMSDLVAQAPPSGEALILNLGDYFHSNDATNATPASKHVLDIDSRFYKVVTTGIRLFMDCIDLALQKHQTVRVRCLPGNHDPESSLALTVALSAFYHSDPRVIVEEDPSEFFFMRFGATLIGACHGHRMRPDRMAMSMATMRPQDWGASKFRWFLFGHIHHETVKEVGDVRCESFQTIAAKDAYAANHGYQAGQSLTSVTLHRERGEIGRHRVNVLAA